MTIISCRRDGSAEDPTETFVDVANVLRTHIAAV